MVRETNGIPKMSTLESPDLYISHGKKKGGGEAGRQAACAAGENNEGPSRAVVMREINQTQKAQHCLSLCR